MRMAFLILLVGISPLYGMPLFNIDCATFRAGETTLLQIYAMIQRNSLSFQFADSVFIAEYTIRTEIKRGDSSLASVTYDRIDRVHNLNEITSTQKIPEEASFHIKPGDFTVVVSMTDNKTGETRRREHEVKISTFSQDQLALSDLEFASKVERVTESGHFVKHKLLVIPNADRIYGGDLMTAYYYCEVYNLSLEDQQKEYTVIRHILDQNRQIIESLPEKKAKQQASSVVENGSFPCNALPTGTYYLTLALIDGCTGAKAETEKQFWVYKSGETMPVQPATTFGKLEDLIGKLEEKEAHQEIEYLRYLTDRSEEKVIKKLEPQGYKNFLLNFWRGRDTTGEMRQNYLARVAVANERYSSSLAKGWTCDRGRVFILFGEPDLVDPRNFELGGPDSEVWHYDQIEGGVIFLFVDLKGTGELQQVYSTKRGEFVDAGWIKEMETRNPGILQELRTY